MTKKAVEATINGADQWTPWYKFRPRRNGETENAGLRIGDGTTWSGTVTVQTKDPDESDSAASDGDTFTVDTRKTLTFAEEVDVRVGIKSGQYTSGTIPVRIQN